MLKNKKKVMVGMSGGVDSSVAAALLVRRKFDVIGAFMKNWSDGGDGQECTWRKERRDAMRVAAQLGIPLKTFDFEREYRQHVYEYMIREYKAGRTPNPDVLCNKYMKFGYLLREAKRMGCDFVATGHYARVEREGDGGCRLLAGADKNKDQSYFLCQLMQEQLKHVMFPIGEMKKPAVRKKAKDFRLHVADKKDSQGICFVGKVDMKKFLKERIPGQKGDIVTTDGKVIGKHDGYAYYTIGQRSGLGIGGGTPYYVVERKPEANEVIVAEGDDEKLYSKGLTAVDLVNTGSRELNTFIGQPVLARIRYRQPLQKAVIKQIVDGRATIVFDTLQKAVAPGQFVAFYNGDELLGSGVIERCVDRCPALWGDRSSVFG